MMQENKPDQAAANKESANAAEGSEGQKPGELSIEELAKVAGGRVSGIIRLAEATNIANWSGPKPSFLPRN